jgi:hypothetical protein
MDPKEKATLEAVLKLSQENNDMLRKMHRSLWWSRAWRIGYWAVIILFALTGYYYAQPYLEKVKQIYDSVEHTVLGVSKVTQ